MPKNKSKKTQHILHYPTVVSLPPNTHNKTQDHNSQNMKLYINPVGCTPNRPISLTVIFYFRLVFPPYRFQRQDKIAKKISTNAYRTHVRTVVHAMTGITVTCVLVQPDTWASTAKRMWPSARQVC